MDSYFAAIHKSGNKNHFPNYRSMCNQSAIPKLLDFLVSDHLHFICKELIINNQHSFIKISQLCETCTYIVYEHKILNAQMDSICIDFSKPFDNVDHEIFLRKLVN